MKNRQGYFVTDTERECTNCGAIFKRTSKTVTLCNVCNSERVKATRTVEQGLFLRAKNRAKETGKDFDLELSDIVVPKFCKYLNIPLERFSGKSGGKANSPALDRIDNSKGYVKGNIQVISHLANQMKASATKEQLILFCRKMLSDLDQE